MDIEGFVKFFFRLWAAWLLFCLVLLGAGILVVIHFVGKYW